MKKIILKVIITALLLSTSAFASNTKSLIAIEGSSNYMNVDNDDTPALSDKKNFVGVGLKIGAETETYRIFLSARDNIIDGYDYTYTLGGELQYLVNFSSFANLFIGVSGGYASLMFEDEVNITRKLSSNYYGGDLGFNLHPDKDLDLEFGIRIVKLKDSTHLQNNITYDFDNITSAYISIIFKYDMDKF